MNNKNITLKRVTLYYADWCGHCVSFKPEWFKFKAAYNISKEEIRDKYKIALIINEYENDRDPIKISEAGVTGFPTVKIEYNDKTDDYLGGRTAMDLFKKLIFDNKTIENEIMSWLEKVKSSQPPIYGEVSLNNNGDTTNPTILQTQIGFGGYQQYNIKDPKILYSNSYKKYIKYKKKCENLLNKIENLKK